MVQALENLSIHYRIKGDATRAALYSKLTAEEQARGTPRILSEVPVFLLGIPADEGLTNKEMEALLDSAREKGLKVSDWARRIIGRADVSKDPQASELMALDNLTMGLPEYPTTTQVWEKSAEFGNKISAERFVRCAIEAAEGKIPVEIGKPFVAIMEPVAGTSGGPGVLCLGRSGGGLWLDGRYADSDDQWGPVFRFVVSSRK